MSVDDVGELLHPLHGLVANVPDAYEVTTWAKDPVYLPKSIGVVEPVEGLGHGEGVDRRCRERDGLRGPADGIDTRADLHQLVAHGVDIDQALPGGATPLMVACALGNDPLVQVLLVRGASALAQDEIGNTALHVAAQYAFAADDAVVPGRMFDRLLDAGAPIDAPNRDAQTPLLLLLGTRAESGTRSPNRETVSYPHLPLPTLPPV